MAKKMTKKQIIIDVFYNKYNIECDGEKIRTPYGNWIPFLLPYGSNTKVGDAYTWSIWHGNETYLYEEMPLQVQAVMDLANVDEITGSCPYHCPECYCDKGNYRYGNNKASVILKLLLVKQFPKWVENAICAQLEISEKIKQVRIHAQGDFFSKEYAEMWARIAKRFPHFVFWTYTKEDFALSVLSGIDNLKIVPSCTECGFNYGTAKELVYKYNKLSEMGHKVHICACGTDLEKHCSDCEHGCKKVGDECDYVLFIEHSGSYKFKKDTSEYHDAVIDIIAKQNN